MDAWTLCTRDDVAEVLSVDVGQLKDTWSLMVEEMIREHLGSPNLGVVVTETEVHNGDGTTVLRVRKPPIQAVNSLSVAGVQIDSGSYVLRGSFVQLKDQTFPKGIGNVEISYQSGSSTVPNVVKLTAIMMVIALYNYSSRRGADGSLRWGSTKTDYGEASPSVDLGLAAHLKGIMETMLRRYTVRAR